MRWRNVMAGAAGTVLTLAGSGMPAPAAPAHPAHDTTTPAEARRVDSVPLQALRWEPCRGTFQCTTITLPLDYDRPAAGTVGVRLLRQPAMTTDPHQRIGALLFNPGGPGGSGMDLVEGLAGQLAPQMRERFDLIGFDPRGIAESQALRCFRSDAEASEVAADYLRGGFPASVQAERARTAAARTVAARCAAQAGPLAGAVHTAQVARDMDVIRRTLGDAKLNYLGFSYGSVLGQYYAAMFPDRIRALAIDGVVDARDWVGTPQNRHRTVFDRAGSGEASHATVTEYLRRCDRVGPERCALSRYGRPAKTLDRLFTRLAATPVTLHGDTPLNDTLLAYQLTVMSFAPFEVAKIDPLLSSLTVLTQPGDPAAHAKARTVVEAIIPKGTLPGARTAPDPRDWAGRYAVLCGDVDQTSTGAQIPALADQAAERSGYFGRFRAWQSDVCAADHWRVPAVDRYTGPFHKRTSAPVLVSGNTWDPATAHRNALTVAAQLAGSHLLDSDSWGHVAYGSSRCATDAIDNYLLTLAAPPSTQCVGQYQPFAETQATDLLPRPATGPPLGW